MYKVKHARNTEKCIFPVTDKSIIQAKAALEHMAGTGVYAHLETLLAKIQRQVLPKLLSSIVMSRNPCSQLWYRAS